MKKVFIILCLSFIFIPFYEISASNLSDKLKGKILLQVEGEGQAWYIDPSTKERAYLGRPNDAFRIMRELGLGIKHSELEKYLSLKFPDRLSGKILLDVEQNGEAYYVFPGDLKGYYLGRPTDAFKVMREKGLGIKNEDLNKVPVFEKYSEKIKNESAQSDLIVSENESDKKSEDENRKISEIISSAQNTVATLRKTKSDNQKFIDERLIEMKNYEDYLLVQSSGQQMITEIQNQNIIIEEQINKWNMMISEYENLQSLGKTTSTLINSLGSQLSVYLEEYKLNKARADNIIKTYVNNVATALKDQVAKKSTELERLKKANDALDELSSYIDVADQQLANISGKLDDKQNEIDEIKNKPVSMSTINARLVKPIEEYNALTNEYNTLLGTRSNLARLYNVVLDYAKNNTSLTYADLQALQAIGIYL